MLLKQGKPVIPKSILVGLRVEDGGRFPGAYQLGHCIDVIGKVATYSVTERGEMFQVVITKFQEEFASIRDQLM
jgi:hypothetical protein